MISVLLAVSQPTPEGGPFDQIFAKFLNLTYYFSGIVAMVSLLAAVGIYVYEKATMQKSSVLSTIMMVLVLVGLGAAAAQVVNWAQGG